MLKLIDGSKKISIQDVQTPPSSGGRKKSNARKRVVSVVVRKLKIKLKSKPASEPQQPPPEPQAEPQQPSSPPHQSPIPHPSPPPHQSPPHQSPPHQSPPQQPSPQLRISTPIHEQPFITSPHILQTPPTSQPPVQTTSGSSGLKDSPPVLENIALEDIGDFNFVTDDLRKKKLDDREKKLEDRVKTVEAENSSLLKKVEADQADIDILKVRIAELEEEKARRDEQNEYFKLKNKELESNNAKKEHEMYMMNKVLENLIEKPVEQRFEEIELEEVRARRKAEIEAEMEDKGKGIQVESVAQVTERAIIVSEPQELQK
ncbi:putative transcription factor bZIP family [Helianthus anomalus]